MKPEKIVKGLTDYLISRDIVYELLFDLDNKPQFLVLSR